MWFSVPLGEHMVWRPCLYIYNCFYVQSLIFLQYLLFMQQTFRKDQEKMDYSVPRHPEFRYKTEFQSHEPEVLCIFHWQFVLHQYEHVWLLDSWNFWIQISWYQTQLCNIYKSLSISFEITFFFIYSYTLFLIDI